MFAGEASTGASWFKAMNTDNAIWRTIFMIWKGRYGGRMFVAWKSGLRTDERILGGAGRVIMRASKTKSEAIVRKRHYAQVSERFPYIIKEGLTYRQVGSMPRMCATTIKTTVPT